MSSHSQIHTKFDFSSSDFFSIFWGRHTSHLTEAVLDDSEHLELQMDFYVQSIVLVAEAHSLPSNGQTKHETKVN